MEITAAKLQQHPTGPPKLTCTEAQHAVAKANSMMTADKDNKDRLRSQSLDMGVAVAFYGPEDVLTDFLLKPYWGRAGFAEFQANLLARISCGSELVPATDQGLAMSLGIPYMGDDADCIADQIDLRDDDAECEDAATSVRAMASSQQVAERWVSPRTSMKHRCPPLGATTSAADTCLRGSMPRREDRIMRAPT